jgi:hypothetical protein
MIIAGKNATTTSQSTDDTISVLLIKSKPWEKSKVFAFLLFPSLLPGFGGLATIRDDGKRG